MITRPLELSSRLRAAPRNYDWLFVVNVAAIAVCFSLFGSQFVLSPGLGVDFALPMVQPGAADLRPTSHVITVVNEGQIFVRDGVRTLDELPDWLRAEARKTKRPALLVRAGAGVPASILARVLGMAHAAGFSVTLAVEEAKPAP
jgi:biopolymer transport protein ExbD